MLAHILFFRILTLAIAEKENRIVVVSLLRPSIIKKSSLSFQRNYPNNFFLLLLKRSSRNWELFVALTVSTLISWYSYAVLWTFEKLLKLSAILLLFELLPFLFTLCNKMKLRSSTLFYRCWYFVHEWKVASDNLNYLWRFALDCRSALLRLYSVSPPASFVHEWNVLQNNLNCLDHCPFLIAVPQFFCIDASFSYLKLFCSATLFGSQRLCFLPKLDCQFSKVFQVNSQLNIKLLLVLLWWIIYLIYLSASSI
jgi:hypothetical protein